MQYFEETGFQLVKNGYLIFPVPRGTKAPKANGWQRERNTTAEDVQLLVDMGYGGANVGIITGRGDTPVCMVDIDCRDETLSARMLAWCEQHLGPTVERVGQPPKMGLVYRCPEGMTKITGARFKDAEGGVHGFEVLGAGQQFVAYGRHPNGMDYRQDGLYGSMLDTPASALPLVSEAQLAAAKAEWARLCEADGWTREAGGGKGRAPREVGGGDEDAIPEPPVTLTPDGVKELLTWFDPAPMAYDEWLRVGQALHHQFEGGDDGLGLWDEWSQRDGARYDHEVLGQKWDSFGQYPGRKVTLRTYIKEANRLRAEAERSEFDSVREAAEAEIKRCEKMVDLADAARRAARLIDGHVLLRPVLERAIQERYRELGQGARLPKADVRHMLRPAVRPLENFLDREALDDAQRAARDALPLLRTETGRVQSTLGNLAVALASKTLKGGDLEPNVCGVWLAWDTFAGDAVIADRKENGQEQWVPLQDAHLIRLRMLLESGAGGFLPIGKELMRDAITYVCSRNTVDTGVRWLSGLEWDGVPRIDRFLVDYCGADDDDYSRALSAYIWSGLAGRVMDGGCQLDIVPALIGAQGVGKTSLLRLMAADPGHYLDLHLGRRDDDTARLLRGRTVVELGEMRGMRQRELEDVKAFITRTHEEWIPKFREMRERYARRFMLFITTNEEEILEDVTGNRRSAPIVIRSVDRERVKEDRDQLWAEGALRYGLVGIEWQGVEALARARHEKHEVRDAWEAPILAWLEGSDSPVDSENPVKRRDDKHGFSLYDLMKMGLGLTNGHIDMRSSKRAGAALRRLGYVKKVARVDGVLAKRWVNKSLV